MSDVNSIITTYSTAAAAIFAAVSACAAVAAMRKSSQFSRETLEESQKANRRQTFEQRYTLLLTQHNNLHAALCTYLDDEPAVENQYGVSCKLSEYDQNKDGLERYFFFLTGHAVISPYMRVLFHLLKHINSDPYMADRPDPEKRLYSSPLRSCIRNDVLFLIAVNALNVRSEKVKEAGYPEYQKLLHKFNFFEHTVFSNPRKPNEPFPFKEFYSKEIRKLPVNEQENEFYFNEIRTADSGFKGCFIKKIRRAKIASYENYIIYQIENNNCQDMLPTPLSSCLLVYANPHQNTFKKALENYLEHVFVICKDIYISTKAEFEKTKDVLDYIEGYYTYGNEETHFIGSLKVLHKLVCEEDFHRRVATVLMRPGISMSEGVKLSEVRDKIKTRYEMKDIVWPKDEAIFFGNLRKQIDAVSDQALRSFLSSCQCKFDAETLASSR